MIQPFFEDEHCVVYHGDCREVIPQLSRKMDYVLTDPPYGLSFMDEEWDSCVPGKESWKIILDGCKPGAFLAAFGGTRKFHRLACAIEDAGWILKDCVMWVFARGFPKGHNISAAIDRVMGAEREVVGVRRGRTGKRVQPHGGSIFSDDDYEWPERYLVTAPATEEAKAWAGWNPALRPSWEPIILAMKKLNGTYAQNALKHGVAGLNINGARISPGEPVSGGGSGRVGNFAGKFQSNAPLSERRQEGHDLGRWPSNAIFSHHPECIETDREVEEPGYDINRCVDGAKPFGGGAGHEYERISVSTTKRKAFKCHPDCPVRMLNEQGMVTGSRYTDTPSECCEDANTWGGTFQRNRGARGHTDIGGPSRFFFCAKADPAEKNDGIEHLPPQILARSGGARQAVKNGRDEYLEGDNCGFNKIQRTPNAHPTTKPIAVMQYLVKLLQTPTGGVILDPFMGSGSTLLAAKFMGRKAIGIDIDKKWCQLAADRIRGSMPLFSSRK